jgi:tetratricopeptide (TPR) repeat protein
MVKRAVASLVVCTLATVGQDYVGSQSCAGCHRKLYEDYKKTAMGRSMVAASSLLSLAPDKVVVQSTKQNRTFEVFAEKGILYQSESSPDFRVVRPLEYAVGSGVNGFSFIVRRGDHLFQAPLSYYARTKVWGLSPGYEHADYGFSRVIHPACLGCHTGRAQPVPQRSGQYLRPPFQEMAIGCENCHGPGAQHVKAGKPAMIVNPAKLPMALAEDICMNCHQNGDTRIAQPGKNEADFRPGTPLNDTVAILKVPRRATTRNTDLLEHHESMRLSRCYRESGRLSCLSCHNPHATQQEYNAKCLSCHSGAFAASHPPRSIDCTSCHLPKRDVVVIAHSALTNHRIVRIPDQPLADDAFQQTAEDAPDLVHFNAVRGKPLPLLTLLRAYGQLLDTQPAYEPRFQRLLEQASKEHSDDPLVLATLGRRSLRANHLDEAVDYLTRSITRGAGASSTFEDLGEALARLGRLEESLSTLNSGIAQFPFAPVLYKSKALRLIKLERYEEAQKTLEQYMDLFPEDDFVRKLLRQVSAPR